MRTFTRSATATVLLLGLLLAGSAGPTPTQAQSPRKLDIAHITAPPESSAIGFKYLAEEVTKRSNGGLNVVFHGGTLLSKELEIMDAVKSGNIAIGRNGIATAPATTMTMASTEAKMGRSMKKLTNTGLSFR